MAVGKTWLHVATEPCYFRFEFEEFKQPGGVGEQVSPCLFPPLTIISNPSASKSHKSCLILKTFKFTILFERHLNYLIALVSLETSGGTCCVVHPQPELCYPTGLSTTLSTQQELGEYKFSGPMQDCGIDLVVRVGRTHDSMDKECHHVPEMNFPYAMPDDLS